ncbi:hypothetical protein [Hyphobacterium marinum]|uniref:Uncharacterized protein n=1 Tax=Hyphobacterium marinum TaxID=3116574 RepID=A0ABU7LZJ2_9PROT|nr:hypothetical protein [Hyphobacterium sp. Y6023]MEE2566977.1 hypothetical protein [Hyphobacterium sp. Y6023]
MLRSIAVAVGFALAAGGCVATPAARPNATAEIQLTENERALRTAVRALDARYEEAGWSVGDAGQSAMRLAAMLLNGGSDEERPLPSMAYLESRRADGAPASAILADVREARDLAAEVTTASMAISSRGLVQSRERLAADLALTERAIADVRRAVDLFETVAGELSAELNEDDRNALNARILTLRQEFTRLGEAADALSERRRALPGSIIG